MPGLAEALADLADEARPYGDAAAAVRTARTARRRRDVLTAAVAALTGLALMATGLWGPSLRSLPGIGPAAPARTFPYPAGPLAPLPYTPLLPAGAVGAASFVGVRVDPAGDQISVVMPDGRQYRIDLPHTPGVRQSMTLSRDGRYLVWTTGQWSRLRDLATGEELVVPPTALYRWSADSRWLLGWRDHPSNHDELTEVLGRASYAVGNGEPWLEALDQGRLLRLAGYRLDGLIPMMVDDVVDGGLANAFSVDVAPYLRSGDLVASHDPGRERVPYWVGVGQDNIGAMAIANPTLGSISALLVFSTLDGSVLRRVDLPNRRATQRSILGWGVDAVDRNLVIISEVHRGYLALLVVDPSSGHTYEVTRLVSGEAGWGHVAVRGGVATWD
jgi:hypothetical protein